MERSGDDSHSISPVESNAGLILNELGSRIQGNADTHDPSSIFRLAEEIKRIQQNHLFISFDKRYHRLIQHFVYKE